MTGNKCKNCGSSELEVDPGRGDTICTNCGTVLEDSVIVSDVQFEENAHGGSSILGQFVPSDSKGGCIGFGRNFHTSLNKESREITLQNAKRGMSNLCQQLRLNQHCLDTAFNFYKMALNRQLTRGRKNTHVLAACVYITCRIEGTPHLLIDFSDVLQISAFELGRCYLKLSQALCINIPSMDPCLYVLRYANRLEFGDKTHEITMTALRLVQRMKKDFIHSGRRPSGLCGAALLVAARLHEFNRTVADIVKIVHVHEATLKKRLVEFGETPSSSLTLDEFMNVDLEEEQDPPSYKTARIKDRERTERLQKLIEDAESSNQLSELQQEIDRQLDEKKFIRKKRLKESSKLSADEERDASLFVAESTLDAIQECLTEVDVSSSTVPVGIGPTNACMGLEREPAVPQETPAVVAQGTQELDLEGLDDAEIDSYIMSACEAQNKDSMWTALNANYLKEQKEKEEKLAKEREEGKPEKKKRKYSGKKNRNTPANSAGEAIEKMLQEKKISTKINYDVLKSLNFSFNAETATAATQDEEGALERSSKAVQQVSPPTPPQPPPPLPPPKKERAVPRLSKPKAVATQEVNKPLSPEPVTVLPDNDGEVDADLEVDDYEEEELPEQAMSLTQMLNKHRDDDNYYGYDDDDY